MKARLLVPIIAALILLLLSFLILGPFKEYIGNSLGLENNQRFHFVGSYIGGIIGTLVSFINLVLFLYITFYLRELEDRRRQREIISDIIKNIYSAYVDFKNSSLATEIKNNKYEDSIELSRIIFSSLDLDESRKANILRAFNKCKKDKENKDLENLILNLKKI